MKKGFNWVGFGLAASLTLLGLALAGIPAPVFAATDPSPKERCVSDRELKLNRAVERDDTARLIGVLRERGTEEFKSGCVPAVLLSVVERGQAAALMTLLAHAETAPRDLTDLVVRAAKHGRASIVALVLATQSPNRKIDWDSKRMKSALHFAAANGDVATLALLLGAPGLPKDALDARDERNWTPAMVAARRGQLATLQYLSQRGADMRVTGGDGVSVMDGALAGAHAATVAWLLCDARTEALHRAGWRGKVALAAEKALSEGYAEVGRALGEAVKHCPSALTEAGGGIATLDAPAASPSPAPANAAVLHGDYARGCPEAPAFLESNGPNRVGFASYADDTPFMDITLALRAPLAYRSLTHGNKNCDGPHFLFLGFDMRAAFYLGTRPSSPVVLRSISPSLHYRYYPRGGSIGDRDNPATEYLDIEYGHLSNGQSVDTQDGFREIARRLGDADFARRFVSRGWDYAGATYKRSFDGWPGPIDRHDISLGVRRYFGGLFQQRVEEFAPFEEPRKIARLAQVSGLSLNYSAQFSAHIPLIGAAALSWSTGTREPFRWNSTRLEFTTRNVPILDLPLTIWMSDGYMNDLSQYYRRVSGFGIAVSFETFRTKR
ncbi:MAG: ankyrin repeat domain-containing protein [Burkholderiales bacterium]|nr:ankyrin repeat domain-containing protein [Burkholderiales bacterium]